MFDVIVADPPWFYNDRRDKHTRFCGGARTHYDVMKTSDLAALPICMIASKNSYLFLWATWPTLPDALIVMAAWGFRYRTLAFCWTKVNRDGSPWHGIGYYMKSGSEPCLLGVRGKPWKHSDSISSTILASRRRHSQKPEGYREKIQTFCGSVRYVELFARPPLMDGWMSVGDEVDGRDIRDTLREFVALRTIDDLPIEVLS